MLSILSNNFISRSPPATRKALVSSSSAGLSSSNGHSITSPIAEVASSAPLSPTTGYMRNRSRSPTPKMTNVAKIGSDQAQVNNCINESRTSTPHQHRNYTEFSPVLTDRQFAPSVTQTHTQPKLTQ